jgi:hypothetical protein
VPEQGGDVFPTEKVAYWFFRLNGCLTIENFVVHPDSLVHPGSFGGQLTDADILGIRFPHRSEGPPSRPMHDHPQLMCELPLLFIAEVKLRRCELNGPWTRPEAGNMARVLRAVGLHPRTEVEAVAEALYNTGRYRGDQSEARLYALGDEVDPALSRRRPGVYQLTWDEILGFVHDRFTAYRSVKADHQQWGFVGRRLYDLVEDERDRKRFIRRLRARLRDERGRGLPRQVDLAK